MTRTVHFTTDDRYGLWKAGDEAEHLGRESPHPNAPNIHLFNLRGETIALSDPFERGLVTFVKPQ